MQLRTIARMGDRFGKFKTKAKVGRRVRAHRSDAGGSGHAVITRVNFDGGEAPAVQREHLAPSGSVRIERTDPIPVREPARADVNQRLSRAGSRLLLAD